MTPVPHDLGAAPFGRFFLPGPTEVRPEILQAQVHPMIGHRGPDIRSLMERIQFGLQQVFKTERPVFVSASSATGFMEAGIRNSVRGKVLSLVNGAFSQRFADIARACGREVDVLQVPWGSCHDPSEIEGRLRERRYDAVTVVHSETSTGALQPLGDLAWVVGEHEETFLLVDSVTGVGGAPVETDRWALDFILTGSQKALALPPGLAFAVASPKLLRRAASIPDRGVYFDLVAFQKNLEKFQTPNTPALTLLYALLAQLTDIQAEGMDARVRRHQAMAAACAEWIDHMREDKGMELSILAPPGYRSPTVTCIRLPEDIHGPAVVENMRRRGFVIGGGYGKLGDTTIRIGHMGDHTVAELTVLLKALEEALRR